MIIVKVKRMPSPKIPRSLIAVKMIVTPEAMEEAAFQGLARYECAAYLGISMAQLAAVMDEDPELDAAYRRGRVNLKRWAVSGFKQALNEKPNAQGFLSVIRQLDEQRVSEVRKVNKKSLKDGAIGELEDLVAHEVERLTLLATMEGALTEKDSRMLERYSAILTTINKKPGIDEEDAQQHKYIMVDVAAMSEEQRKARLKELDQKRMAQLGPAKEEKSPGQKGIQGETAKEKT